MKKYLILCSSIAVLALNSCTKSSEQITSKPKAYTLADGGGVPVVLNTIIDVNHTISDIMLAIESSLQPDALYVKIGNYGGGTDTAKKKWSEDIKSDMAAALGITVQQLEDMNGIDLLAALFPGITSQETGIFEGGADVTGIEYQASNSFAIHAGPIGSDEINAPELILNFQVN